MKTLFTAFAHDTRTKKMKRLINLSLVALLSTGSLSAQKLPGTADSTFNGNGYGLYRFGDKHAQLGSGYIDQNGKLVIIGGSINAQNKWDVGLTRLNMNGSEDMSFRNNVGPSHIDFNNGENDGVSNIAATKDGGAIGVGTFTGQNGTDIMVVKFDATGTVQLNFATNGYLTHEVDPGYEKVTHVLEDKNGKFVLLGDLPFSLKKMFVMRLNSNGTIDSSFSGDGIMYLDPMDLSNTPAALLERPQGGYYVVSRTSGNGATYVSVTSVSNNGNINIDLGGPGEVSLKVNGNDASPIDAVYHNGSIFICGTYPSAQGNDDGFLARLEKDGTWNTTFAGTGFARIVHNLANPYDEEVLSMCIAPDSSIFISTIAHTPDTLTLMLSRYKTDGNVEGLFGNQNGRHHEYAIADTVSQFGLYDLVLDTGSQRLYVLGSQSNPSQSGFFVYATYTGEFEKASGGGTGIYTKTEQVRVFPNPAGQWLQLDLSDDQPVAVKIYDVQGREVLQSNSARLNTSALQNGIYYLRAEQAGKLFNAKIQILN